MSFKYVAAGVGLIVAGTVGYAAWSVQAKRTEHRAITALVSEASSGLAAALKQPAPEQAAKLEAASAALQALGVQRQKPYADAADVYLVSARAIAQRQADVARLSKQAQAAREAFAAQVRSSRGRSGAWIRQVTEAQKRMDQAHHDLARVQEALVELIHTLPDAEKQVAPFAGGALVADPALQAAALRRAQEDVKRSAREADEARRVQ
jgi:hypothetical protein